MKTSTRLWLSAALSLLALFGFCVTLIFQIEASREQLLAVAIGGASLVALVVVGTTVLSLQALERRRASVTRALDAMGRTDGEPVVIETDDPDLAGVSAAFNEMSKRLRSEAARRQKAERMLNLIRRLADRLPSCLDDDEFASVIQSFAPLLTGERSGSLYLLTYSRNLLRSGCSWNNPKSSLPEFTPEDCWGLRRGQEHISGAGHIEVPCPHIVPSDGVTHWCMPLVARGETVGLMYLEGADFANAGRRSGQHHVIYMLRETVALGLVNLRLREKLRLQSVRDPLTGLYNRRYLDESLDLELARAGRSQKPVAVIMMDIDHFKKFNDTFGHDAGDAVLKSVANVLARSTRKGDVAGRFGGEEFLFVMPGADVELAVARAESMRQAVATLDVMHGGQKLGRISASFGVASYPTDGDTPELVVQASDRSLYAAKTEGRDRVVASA